MEIRANDSWVKIKCFDDIIPLVNEYYRKYLIYLDDEHKSNGYFNEWLVLTGKNF